MTNSSPIIHEFPKPEKMVGGEFDGWNMWTVDPFEHQVAGPFYFTKDEQGPVCAFRAEERHMNAGQVMHGGCLMTFADYALFGIANEHIPSDCLALTVSFNAEFLNGPKVGELITARGDVLRAGGSLIFVRGIIYAEDRACLNFSGTIKKVKIPKK